MLWVGGCRTFDPHRTDTMGRHDRQNGSVTHSITNILSFYVITSPNVVIIKHR